MDVALHDEICTDIAPGGLDASWGLTASNDMARPGQVRLRDLVEELDDAAVVVISLDRLTSVVRETEWLLERKPGAPALVVLAEGLSTVDADGLAGAADFLNGAAAERRARRAAPPGEERPARGLATHSREFKEGVWWERAAPPVRSRDSLESRRLAGLPHCGPSRSSYAPLAERFRSMRDGGMTLQAIADTLNAEGVRTIRGGVMWRRSSLQNLAGTAPQDEAGWFA
jgi:hypothetical protein